MELTAAQRLVTEHDGGPLRLVGGAGTGRTTALAARYRWLVERGHRPSSVLVVCRDRAAAIRFRDAVLPHVSGGFDALVFTTWFGLAFDLVTRARGPVRLLPAAEQRRVVRRLLASESAADWPSLGRFLGRAAFADEVAHALRSFEAQAHPELDRFARRYQAHLGERGQVDATGLLAAAAEEAVPGRFGHVLVDDHDGSSPLLRRLLGAVAGDGAGAAVVSDDPLPWPATDVAMATAFRRPADPVLVTCRHPSMEAEAVADELLAARAEGVPWPRMAVLVRSPRERARGIARALGRHGIPVTAGPAAGSGASDPAVAAIVDMLKWGAGDDTARERLLGSPLSAIGEPALARLRDDLAARAAGAPPAELAFEVWERGLGHLVGGAGADEASLDAVTAFLDRLWRQAEHDPSERLGGFLAELDDGEPEPDPWRTSATAAERQGVTVASIRAAAGREWHTVVVAGCVEGELPRVTARAPLFDVEHLTPAGRRQASLAEERRLFLTACSRATGRLVATAAPQPGVLLSRFVEGWQGREPRRPVLGGPSPPPRHRTESDVAVFPDGRLVLSASQLDTYDDCPLRYAYQYGVRVRDDAGAPAALGSLVHEVLAEFLRPGRPGERSRQELLAMAAERWRDDLARYRPQVEECRRDYYTMLEDWWAAEGEGFCDGRLQVLAVEHPFDIEVGDVRLVGAIDRVDRALDGEGIRIVDYKTGRKEPRPDQLPDDLQLAVYHLAATRDPSLAALGPPRQLQLLYLRTMRAYEQPIVAGHAEATAARVAAAAADIRQERFEPSVDASCRTCPFHRLCPLQREGREVGVR